MPHNQYYMDNLPLAEQQQAYMLPYNSYHQAHHFHANSAAVVDSGSQIFNMQTQHMPPSKRPRVEIRNKSALTPPQNRQQNGPGWNNRASSTTGSYPRKTHSDFRISSIKIGSWSSDESKVGNVSRDSKIRFCFRNSSDRDPSSTLSATEAALLAPDRLSISVFRGTRRIVIPAHHIKSVEFTRTSGKFVIKTDGWAAFEHLTESQSEKGQASNDPPITTQLNWVLTEEDITCGQLSSAKEILIQLDLDRPLTEPKWTRGNLADYINPSSRFVLITKIVDIDIQQDIDQLLARWIEQDTDKEYFCEYHLGTDQLLKLVKDLMKTDTVMNGVILSILEGLLQLLRGAKVSRADEMMVFKRALLLMPQDMLFEALNTLYKLHEELEDNGVDGDMLNPENSFAGSKRQRGESEVPSDQLAKTTLDEKRRRLSDSEPQPSAFRSTSKTQSSINPRSRVFNVSQDAGVQETSKFSSFTKRIDSGLVPSKFRERAKSEGSPASNDGTKFSRVELLFELEAQEDQESLGENEDETAQASPSETDSVTREDRAPCEDHDDSRSQTADSLLAIYS